MQFHRYIFAVISLVYFTVSLNAYQEFMSDEMSTSDSYPIIRHYYPALLMLYSPSTLAVVEQAAPTFVKQNHGNVGAVNSLMEQLAMQTESQSAGYSEPEDEDLEEFTQEEFIEASRDAHTQSQPKVKKTQQTKTTVVAHNVARQQTQKKFQVTAKSGNTKKLQKVETTRSSKPSAQTVARKSQRKDLLLKTEPTHEKKHHKTQHRTDKKKCASVHKTTRHTQEKKIQPLKKRAHKTAAPTVVHDATRQNTIDWALKRFNDAAAKHTTSLAWPRARGKMKELNKAYAHAQKALTEVQATHELAQLEARYNKSALLQRAKDNHLTYQEQQQAVDGLLAYINTTQDTASRYRLAQLILHPTKFSSKHGMRYAQELQNILREYYLGNVQTAKKKLDEYQEHGDAATVSVHTLGMRSPGDAGYLEQTYGARWRTAPR
jgi:hypothetical protein